MPSSEPANPSQFSSVGEGGGDERHNKQKQLDRDIREMVTSITNRITDFQYKSGHAAAADDDGVRIITLAGTNDGATMRSRVDDEKAAEKKGDDDEEEEEEVLSTYVNSNFQAFNNSIMFSGSYQAHDPGVNVDISDFTEPVTGRREAGKHGKKKEKEVSKSDG